MTHATPTSSPESIELTAESEEITMDPPSQSQSLQLSPQLFSSSEIDDDEAPVLRRGGVRQRGGRGVCQRGGRGVCQRGGRGVRQGGDEIRQRGEVARGRVRGGVVRDGVARGRLRVRGGVARGRGRVRGNVSKSTTQYLIFQHNFVLYIYIYKHFSKNVVLFSGYFVFIVSPLDFLHFPYFWVPGLNLR